MKVIVAARLSKLQKDGRAGIGLDTQDTRSQAWAEREGHEVITDPIADTKSGTVPPMDRPNLRPWVTKPELMSQYDGIIAYRNDRLSRGVWADEARIRLWAEEHGKTLMIVDGPQWPPRHDGDKWQWEAMATQARKEWEEDRERSMRAQRELRERGKLVGRPPWGYTSTGEKYDRCLVPTPEGKRYIPEAFEKIAAGESLVQVAAWLTSVTDHTWHPRTVAEKMVRCTTYRGQRRDASGRIVHECQRLVSDELFKRANANLDGRPSPRRGQRTDLAGGGAALLSGLVYCGAPGCTAGADSPMYRISPPGRPALYRCSGRGAQRRGCGASVPLDAADALMDRVMSELRRPVLRPVFHPSTGHQAEIDNLTQQLHDLPLLELPEDEEDTKRAWLRKERREKAALPAKKAWTEYVAETDEAGEPITYGSRWASSDQATRRAWLRSAGFQAYLAKPDMVDWTTPEDADDEHPEELFSRVDGWENKDAALIFVWSGDDDAGLARGLH